MLTDFGIARVMTCSALTTVDVLIGSPSYIAPERARGGQSGLQATCGRLAPCCTQAGRAMPSDFGMQ